MSMLEIFGLQFVLSLIGFSLIAKWYVAPWLAEKPANQALMLLLIPHAFRHLGLVFLVPGVVASTMPDSFAVTAGYGDLASGLLALSSLIVLRAGWGFAVPLIWLFSLVGILDLASALRQADTVPHFGAAWYIPTFVVPILLVTHFMIIARLLRRKH